jgi:hypothetical protein
LIISVIMSLKGFNLKGRELESLKGLWLEKKGV